MDQPVVLALPLRVQFGAAEPFHEEISLYVVVGIVVVVVVVFTKKNRSGLYSVPNDIRYPSGPTYTGAFCAHKPTTRKEGTQFYNRLQTKWKLTCEQQSSSRGLWRPG